MRDHQTESAVGAPLGAVLENWAGEDPNRRDVAATLIALERGLVALSGRIARGALDGDMGEVLHAGEAGEGQKKLDVLADDLVISALRGGPVAAVASEEDDLPVLLDEAAPLLVALDPLDGSSNIDTNLSVGTIFSVLPRRPGIHPASVESFLQSGRDQLAAGYAIYGPHTALLITVGDGTMHFVLDPVSQSFRLVEARVEIANGASEFAINMSNYRHWDEPVRLYIDDCLSGRDGPRERDFNMRWHASLVAEAHRIIRRGGVYLYPADSRKGYGRGRLRLLYEAFPVAFLMEQAGGLATDGVDPIVDLTPKSLHERVPLVFGSRDKVDTVARYHVGPSRLAERSPLFGRRGLFRP